LRLPKWKPIASHGRKRRRLAPAASWAGLCALLTAGSAYAQDSAASLRPNDVVESVRILRNRFIPQDTLLYYVSTKPGDRFDDARLRQDFHRLWDTGFLDDLLLDVSDGPKGKIISFVVEERRRIQVVEYRGSKALPASSIGDELKKHDVALATDSFFDEAKARHVDAVLKEMLEGKGRPFATVKHETKPVGGGSGVAVTFIINDGDRARVREIEFTGNKTFTDKKLRGAMTKIKKASFWNFTWLTGKSTYTADKWSDPQEGDQSHLQEFFLDRGYVTATVGEPKITYYDGMTTSWLFHHKPVRWMKLEIPVTEGEQYRVGKIDIKGLTVFKEDPIRALFKLKTGDVYKESRLRKGYDKLRDIYGANGYFQWQPLTERKPDPEKKVVDVTLTMEEDKRYFVGKINFTGNDMTKDKVIRREVYLNEGDVFNTEALKQSIKRINQLGYFKPMEKPPEITPAATSAEDHLDLTFKIEEQNRNQFTFGAGVSGLEGTFVNASFQTSNFLGAGETFNLSAQSGARTKNYQFGVTEPYMFDRPITAGIDLFKRKIEYQTTDFTGEKIQGYFDDRTGISLTTGWPLGPFSRLFVGYSYEIVKISIGEVDTTDPLTQVTPVVSRFFLQDAGTRHVSQITPSIVYNTVDNPYTPRSGKKATLSFGAAGGPLGGTEDILKPNIELIGYLKHTKVTSLGVRVEAAWVLPFGQTTKIDPQTGHNRLPFYERFLLGGENQLRGFDVRTIGPVENGLPTANKFLLGNAEYYFDVIGPLRMLLFFDVGQAYAEGTPMKLKGFQTSTGIEGRFIMPVLNVPFRLIYAYNPNRPAGFPKGGFKFAVGSTF
jgi:outer membrane protein insertion porin family